MVNLFEGLESMGFSNIDSNKLFTKPQSHSTVGRTDQTKHVVDEPTLFLFERKFLCPACEENFLATSVRPSKVKLVRSDTDLRPYFEPHDPLYYDAVVCPHCGYAALASFFSKIEFRQIKLIMEHITPKFISKKYAFVYTLDDAIERYKLVLLNAMVKKAKDSEKAYICLKLAWLHREKENAVMEQAFLQHALTGFTSAYLNEHLPLFGMDEDTLAYLIGELNRRCGKLEDAMRYVGSVIVSRNASKRLKDRAIDVKDLIIKEKKLLESKATTPPPVAVSE